MKHIFGIHTSTTLTNVQENDIQPNGVDCKVDRVLKIRNHLFVLSEEEKIHRGTIEIFPDSEGYFNLDIGSYEIVLENIINVGENEAGWFIVRSTLNRNGIYITSGLFDSGYHGVAALALHNNIGPARIKRGTRIAQYINFDAEALHKYNGSYGIGKEHDIEKYQS